MSTLSLVRKLARRDKPVTTAIIGMGAMGRGLFHQLLATPGFSCTAIADIDLDRAAGCAEAAGRPFQVVSSPGELQAAVEAGRLAVSMDSELIAGQAPAEVIIPSCNSVAAAGSYTKTAILSGKHAVLMNSEVDLIYGPYLAALAEQNGLIYTSCDGDQHGVIKRLADDISLWGFELVMAGNIKGFLDRYSNPTKIIPEADKRRLDYRMATAYTDGTKLGIEMALIANALGGRCVRPGMLGPAARHVSEVFDLFDLNEHWKGEPLVDYILGAEPGGGVFVVGYCEHPYQQSMMHYYKMGSGPFYLFYRPYHLCHVEALQCIAEAVLEQESLLKPDCGFRTNVIAYAKRDLAAGQLLDGLGGYCCYGMLENCPRDKDSSGRAGSDGAPICLADGVRLRRAVPKDGRIALGDVEFDPHSDAFSLYRQALCACRSGEGPPR